MHPSRVSNTVTTTTTTIGAATPISPIPMVMPSPPVSTATKVVSTCRLDKLRPHLPLPPRMHRPFPYLAQGTSAITTVSGQGQTTTASAVALATTTAPSFPTDDMPRRFRLQDHQSVLWPPESTRLALQEESAPPTTDRVSTQAHVTRTLRLLTRSESRPLWLPLSMALLLLLEIPLCRLNVTQHTPSASGRATPRHVNPWRRSAPPTTAGWRSRMLSRAFKTRSTGTRP